MVGMSDAFWRSEYATILHWHPDQSCWPKSYEFEPEILFGKDSIVCFLERQLE